MREFVYDIRYILRRLANRPALTVMAALSLGLGIGANTAVFSFIDGVALRPLPVRNPDRLVRLRQESPTGQRDPVSYPDYLDLREQVDLCDGLAAESYRGAMLYLNGEATLVTVSVVSPNYFSILGVEAARGQVYEPAAGTASSGVLISDRLWRNRFGADPELVGDTIQLNRRPISVVGILKPSFRGTRRFLVNDVWASTEAWVAMGEGNRPELENREAQIFEVFGPLGESAGLPALQAQLDTVGEALDTAYPGSKGRRYFKAFSETAERREDALSVAVLLIPIVVTVLVIACANVANLLLAEGVSRSREIAVRSALGAFRGRLVRQFFAEGAVLVGLGTGVGILLASYLVMIFGSLTPPSVVALDFDLRLDLRVLSATLIVAVLSTLGAALLPAIRGCRVDLVPALKGEESVHGAARSRFLRKAMIVAQMAVCMVLASGALLLVGSFMDSQRIAVGFDSNRQMLLAWTSVDARLRGEDGSVNDEAVTRIGEQRERLEALPGVLQASYARRMHLSPSGGGWTVPVALPAGHATDEPVNVGVNQVAPDYFRTVGTRILAGREFSELDRSGTVPVAVVSEVAAERFWPGANPVGRQLMAGGRLRQVVGVAEDSKIIGVHEDPRPYLYLPYAQSPDGEVTFLIRAETDAGRLAAAVRESLRARPDLFTVLGLRTLDNLMSEALYEDRLFATLGAGLGVVGVFLAAVGLYGFMSQSVRRRSREIGLRMALGAGRRRVLRQVLAEGLKLASAGVIVGSAGAIALTRLMGGFLPEASGGATPLSYLLAAGVVLVVALTGSQRSAYRASRVDPLAALRYE